MRRRCGFGSVDVYRPPVATATVVWANGERHTYDFGTDAELSAFAYALEEGAARGTGTITDYRFLLFGRKLRPGRR